MTLFDIRTVKHSLIYGADTQWQNQWRVSAPCVLSDPVALDLAVYVMELERQIHQAHVIYDYGTIQVANQPATTNEGQARVVRRYGASQVGFQPTPANPSTLREALYIHKYCDVGKVGRWFFYGCLNQADYIQSNHGHIGLSSIGAVNDIIGLWLDNLWQQFGAQLMVSRGMMNTGISTSDEPCNKLLCAGLSLKNASARKQQSNSSPGVMVWQTLNGLLNDLSLWNDQVSDWLAFNADFVPVESAGNTVTLLEDIKAFASKVEQYAEGKPNGDGTNAPAPLFRWQPDADQLLTLAQLIKPKVQPDVDDIQKMEPHLEPDGTQAMTHDQLTEIQARLDKYIFWLAEMVPADWFNPANSQQQSTP